MKMEVLANSILVAQKAAAFIAADARAVVAECGHYTLAVSGGQTPWLMLRALSGLDVPWACMRIVQVDERVAPPGHPDRNLTHLSETLIQRAPLRAGQIYAMPVESPDLGEAATRYAQTLREISGPEPVLDLVHLGLGPDGHAASLILGDPVLEITDADVAITGIYQGRRRMTLTYPIINRSRRILWVVTGSEKAGMLARLQDADLSIPAGRVSQDQAIVMADQAAARQAGPAENYQSRAAGGSG
jgi:6-phosphogluconolactonase